MAVVIEQRIVSGREPHAIVVELLLDILPTGSLPFRRSLQASVPVLQVALTRPGCQVLVTFRPEEPESLFLAALHPST